MDAEQEDIGECFLLAGHLYGPEYPLQLVFDSVTLAWGISDDVGV